MATARLRTCAVRGDGVTACWGFTPAVRGGQYLPEAVAGTPQIIANASPSRQVVVGEELACAILPNGHVRCWTAAGWGPAVEVVSETTYETVAVFGWTACGLTRGTVRCWGRPEDALNPPDRFVPADVAVPGRVASVLVGGEPTSVCVTTEGGLAYAWQEPLDGAPRTSVRSVRECPVPVAVDLDTRNPPNTFGRLRCWLRGTSVYCDGETGCGSLGELSTILGRSPDASRCGRLVRGRPEVVLENVASVAIGARHACALDRDGQLWCWGSNIAGQLGDGTYADSDAPVRPLL